MAFYRTGRSVCIRILFSFFAGLAVLFALTSGKKPYLWGDLYDFLVKARPARQLGGGLVLIDTGEGGGGSPGGVIDRALARSVVDALTETEAATLIIQTPLLNLSGGEGGAGELLAGIDGEFEIITGNIRNLFDGIRTGSVKPVEAGRFVEETVRLTLEGKERLLQSVFRGGTGGRQFEKARKAFGNLFIASDLNVEPPQGAETKDAPDGAAGGFAGGGGFAGTVAGVSGIRDYSRAVPDSDGLVRRIAPLILPPPSPPKPAVSIPDAAVSIPDAAVSVPDAAVSLPDAAVSVPDAAGVPPDEGAAGAAGDGGAAAGDGGAAAGAAANVPAAAHIVVLALQERLGGKPYTVETKYGTVLRFGEAVEAAAEAAGGAAGAAAGAGAADGGGSAGAAADGGAAGADDGGGAEAAGGKKAQPSSLYLDESGALLFDFPAPVAGAGTSPAAAANMAAGAAGADGGAAGAGAADGAAGDPAAGAEAADGAGAARYRQAVLPVRLFIDYAEADKTLYRLLSEPGLAQSGRVEPSLYPPFIFEQNALLYEDLTEAPDGEARNVARMAWRRGRAAYFEACEAFFSERTEQAIMQLFDRLIENEHLNEAGNERLRELRGRELEKFYIARDIYASLKKTRAQIERLAAGAFCVMGERNSAPRLSDAELSLCLADALLSGHALKPLARDMTRLFTAPALAVAVLVACALAPAAALVWGAVFAALALGGASWVFVFTGWWLDPAVPALVIAAGAFVSAFTLLPAKTAGNGRQAAENGYRAAENEYRAAENRRQAAENRRQAAENRRQAAGNRRPAGAGASGRQTAETGYRAAETGLQAGAGASGRQAAENRYQAAGNPFPAGVRPPAAGLRARFPKAYLKAARSSSRSKQDAVFAALVAVRLPDYETFETRERADISVKLREQFTDEARSLFFQAGAVLAGVESGLLLFAFGSPPERKSRAGKDAIVLPVRAAVLFLRSLDFSKIKTAPWYTGLDAGNCVFHWSASAGYTVFGPAAARARLLSLMAGRYNTQTLVSKAAAEYLDESLLRKREIPRPAGEAPEQYFELRGGE